MNSSESSEGSSPKGQENGVVSNKAARPLKKARFAWQVKGKYHLKNESDNTDEESSTTSPNPPPNSDNESSHNNSSSEQDIESFASYINPIDVMFGTPEMSLSPCSSISISPEKLSYPRYLSTYEQNLMNGFRRNESFSSIAGMESVAPSMVPEESLEDQCISRWQSQQAVKASFDNTINRILDIWVDAPPSPDLVRMGSRLIPIDVAEFVTSHPVNENVENEGILMAISAHGLQRTLISNNKSAIDSSEDSDILRISSDDESESGEELRVNNSRASGRRNSDVGSIKHQLNFDLPSQVGVSWTYLDDPNNFLNVFSSRSETRDLSFEREIPNPDQCDLLDEAISFAIQNKGLTTIDSEYG